MDGDGLSILQQDHRAECLGTAETPRFPPAIATAELPTCKGEHSDAGGLFLYSMDPIFILVNPLKKSNFSETTQSFLSGRSSTWEKTG